jgi:hypothetical protein
LIAPNGGIFRWIATANATKNLLPNPVALNTVWLDGAPVVTKGAQMKSLTNEQKQQLVEIISEEHGDGLSQDDFTDALLGLLEDVPGFETAKQRTLKQLIQQLWSQYHD